MSHGYGRIVSPEDSRDFLLHAALPQVRAAVQPVPRLAPYREQRVVDQGETPQCVGYAGRGFLNAAPMMSRRDQPPTATDLYLAAQRAAGIPPSEDGATVRGLMKALKAAGLISSYVWGQNVADAITWMNGGFGSVIVGTWWYPEMEEVDAQGFIVEPAATSEPVDGHCYRINWYHAPSDSFLMVNSWGELWGKPRADGTPSGMAFMRRRLFERLLREDGEIAAPTQVRLSGVLA